MLDGQLIIQPQMVTTQEVITVNVTDGLQVIALLELSPNEPYGPSYDGISDERTKQDITMYARFVKSRTGIFWSSL